MDLTDKVAVVTGAAQGLGRSFAEILLKNGAKVAMIDRNEALGKELKIKLGDEYGTDRIEFFAADISSKEEFKEAFQKAVKRFDSIDIMCNNAGIMNENDWETSVAVNLVGVVRGTYMALEHMIKLNHHERVIINMSSLAGLFPFPAAPISTATKHAVVGFSRAMAAAAKMKKAGVRINVLCPSFVKTSLSQEHFTEFLGLNEEMEKTMEKFGIVEADDVAKAFLALVTDESKNGETLVIDNRGVEYFPMPQSSQE